MNSELKNFIDFRDEFKIAPPSPKIVAFAFPLIVRLSRLTLR